MSDDARYSSFGSLLKKVIDNRGRSCPVTDHGVPLIATNCITNHQLHPQFEKVRYVSAEVMQTWFRGHPEPGDMIFVLKGTPGRVAWVPDPVGFCIAQDMVAIRADETRIYPKYLFAVLRSKTIQQEIEGLHVGSLIPHFKKGDFDDLQIPILGDGLQRYIGNQYFDLSSKIDLLHRQNKTLEAMAETLFRQWFVEAPDGDEMGTVSDVVEFNPKRLLVTGTVAPYLEMASLSTTTFAPESWYDRKFSSGTKFTNGDTLMARITPCLENGKTAYVTFLEEKQVAWGSTEYIVMRPKLGLHPFFAYTLARNSDFRDYAEGCLEGSSGRQRVNIDHLRNYLMAMPDQSTVNKFNTSMNSIVPKLHANSCQIRNLMKLRDTLLPKLMSGDVKVYI